MSLAVWVWLMPDSDTCFIKRSLPYTARSPILNIDVHYETEKDIEDEINRLAKNNKKFPTGQWMFLFVPLWADIDFFIEPWMWDMIQEYQWMKNFNISLGELDQVSAHRLDCFTIIEKEIVNCNNYRQKHG